MSRRSLIAYGLRIGSQIDIPGALPDPAPSTPRDVDIRLDAPQAALSDRIYRFEGADLCFTAPGIAQYRCRPAAIAIAPHPEASAGDIAAMLIATALPALLWMRGGFVLHAAAARMPGSTGAIAVAGPSGIGKSTILAQLVAAGGALIADDTIAIAGGDATGLAGGWFLAEAGEAAGNADRRFHPASAGLARSPLAAILVLSRAPGTIARIPPVAAVAQLLAHRHRPTVPALLGRQAQALADCTLLAGTIPLYSWPRADGPVLTAREWAALERCAGTREEAG